MCRFTNELEEIIIRESKPNLPEGTGLWQVDILQCNTADFCHWWKLTV